MLVGGGNVLPAAALGGVALPVPLAADGCEPVFAGAVFGITIDIGTTWLSPAPAVLGAFAAAPAAFDPLPCMSAGGVEHAALNAANTPNRQDIPLMIHRLIAGIQISAL